MSWLARSIANTLLIEDDDDDNSVEDEARPSSQNDAVNGENHDEQGKVDLDLNHRLDHSEEDYGNGSYNDDGDDDLQGRGVKGDLSEFTETLSRQLWGVASFLAPPPPPPPPPPPLPAISSASRKLNSVPSENEANVDEEEGCEDVENLSDNVEETVVEEDAVGITEEALAFAHNIAHHPETWLDFPLADEEDFEDFEISDIQHKHALAVEHLVPRLAALRIEFCPVHMNEGYFWMVYFVLLFSRLNKLDADLLSTPQLVQARAMWMQELQKRTKSDTDWFGRKTFYSQGSVDSPREHFDSNLSEDSQPRYWFHATDATEPRPHDTTTDFSSDKHSAEGNEVQFTNNSIEDPSGESEKLLLAGPSSNGLLQDYDDNDDDGDDWVEDTAELDGYSATGILGNEEDISFSDLEEDSDWTMPVKPK